MGKLWDVETGKVLQTFQCDAFTRKIIFNPNEQQILAVSLGGTKLWDIQTGKVAKIVQDNESMADDAILVVMKLGC